jgi:cysteine desulfurase
MTYLDNSATTAVSPAVAAKVAQVMTEVFGNPSSLHTLGFAAEQEMTAARAAVGRLLGCPPEQVYFTSGGTEANNIALFGAAKARGKRGRHIVTTAVEHPSVARVIDALEAEGFAVTRLTPGPNGTLTAADILAACRPDTVLVSIMCVNNETGARFPVEAVAAAVHKRCPHALVHCDAVQAVGKIPVKAAAWGVDLLTASAHKLHAPKGVGALYIAKGVHIPPRTLGGEQERGMRAGTESVPLIAAFGQAAAEVTAFAEQEALYRRLRERLLEGLKAFPQVRLHLPEGGVPYIVNVSLPGLRSETLVHFLAQEGVYVSGGSACAKGHKSPVLTALGLPDEEIDSALRISFCRHNTEQDIDAMLAALHKADATLAHTTHR